MFSFSNFSNNLTGIPRFRNSFNADIPKAGKSWWKVKVKVNWNVREIVVEGRWWSFSAFSFLFFPGRKLGGDWRGR